MPSTRRPSLGTVLGATALFVALGGQSFAADAVTSAAHAISGSTIKAGTVTNKQLKDGTIADADLTKALRAKLSVTGTPGATGAIGPVGPQGPQGDPGQPGAPGQSGVVGDGSVTTAKLANDAVTDAKILHDSVGFDELKANSVNSAIVENGSLTSADIGTISSANIPNGTVTTSDLAGSIPGSYLGQNSVRFVTLAVNTINAQTCKVFPFTAAALSLNLQDSVTGVIATPIYVSIAGPGTTGIADNLTVTGEMSNNVNGDVRVKVCNPTSTNIGNATIAVDLIVL